MSPHVLRCLKGMEDDSSNARCGSPVAEYFKMVMPPAGPPAWVAYQRRPHAYEEIMETAQEEQFWGKSGEVTSPHPKWAPPASHDLVKVTDDQIPSQPKMRVLHHKYEEVDVEGEMEWLPEGWRKMKDDQQRDYYCHVASGKAQYAFPDKEKTAEVSVCCTHKVRLH